MNASEFYKSLERLEKNSQQEFFGLYKDFVLSICVRYAKNNAQAEEFFKIVFAKLLNDFTFHPHPGGISIDEYIKHTVIAELVKILLTKKEFYKIVSTVTPRDVDAPILTLPDDELIPLIRSPRFLPTLQQLPVNYRLLVNLYLCDKYDIKKIEHWLDIGEPMIRLNLDKAIHHLRKLLSEHQTSRYAQ